MRRKLIGQGLGGITLSLPIKWTRSKNLEPGDEVELKEINEGLLISTESKKERKETAINLTAADEPSIRNQLNDLYRLGYDKISIQYKDKKQIKIIEQIVTSRLLGFEKTVEDEKKIVIESVTEPNDEKEQVLLRRMFLLIKESLNLVQEDLAKEKLTCLEEMQTINVKVGLYDNFNKRNIYKRRMVEARVNFYWSLYTNLLLTHHSILHLVEELGNKKIKLSKTSLTNLDLVLQHFNSVYESFFKQDINTIRKTTAQLKDLLYNKIQKSLLKSSGIESLFLYYLGELSRLVYLTTVPISSLIV